MYSELASWCIQPGADNLLLCTSGSEKVNCSIKCCCCIEIMSPLHRLNSMQSILQSFKGDLTDTLYISYIKDG